MTWLDAAGESLKLLGIGLRDAADERIAFAGDVFAAGNEISLIVTRNGAPGRVEQDGGVVPSAGVVFPRVELFADGNRRMSAD